ncbi:hypothetical protein MIBA_00950 [Microbacterium proteolyticum]|nr:hypothetical protein [Microbacterium proteolyticum]
MNQRLDAIAQLEGRAASSTGATWLNVSLALVSIVTLFSATLVAAYSMWAQGGIAYWTLQAVEAGGDGDVRDQVSRWTEASAEILGSPNALAENLTGWGVGLSAAMVMVVAVGVVAKVISDRSHRIAAAWLAVYARVWPLEDQPATSRPQPTSGQRPRSLFVRKQNR